MSAARCAIKIRSRESDNNLGKAAEIRYENGPTLTTATVVLTFVPAPGLATKDISYRKCRHLSTTTVDDAAGAINDQFACQ